MSDRKASCRCGQLTARCTGEPVRVSACHCLACKQRSGSAFAVQARFPVENVTVAGQSRSWVATADSGNRITFHFCPDCGTTVHFSGGNFPDLIAIPLGNFEDPYFAAPGFSVWEERRNDWVEIVGEDIEHSF